MKRTSALGLGLGLLAVVPVLAFAFPATVTISPRKARTTPTPAQFLHPDHDGLKCYACHPSIFSQDRQGFTHAEMKQGLYCGACHDGGRASAIASLTCETCHVGTNKK